MPRFQLIIFDLDGTLIDSSRDLAISTNATRGHFGLPPLDHRVINSFVGNGAGMLVKRAMDAEASEQRVADALEFFLKYYRAHALENTRLYPGVREMIGELAEAGCKLGVLTNKPEKISVDILKALGVHAHFFRVCGGNTFVEKKPHPMGILTLREAVGASAAETLMVGDSGVDIATAANAGVPSCGVTWGFQPETLEAQPPDFIIDTPRELLAVADGSR